MIEPEGDACRFRRHRRLDLSCPLNGVSSDALLRRPLKRVFRPGAGSYVSSWLRTLDRRTRYFPMSFSGIYPIATFSAFPVNSQYEQAPGTRERCQGLGDLGGCNGHRA